MCGRGVMPQGKVDGWLRTGLGHDRNLSRSVNATHRAIPFVYFTSNAMAFAPTSLAGLKSSVASIVTIALQTDALAVCRPDDDEHVYELRIDIWNVDTHLDTHSCQIQK